MHVEEPRIEKPRRLDVSHGGEHGFFQMGVVDLEIGNDLAEGAAHSAGLEGTDARNNGNPELFGVRARNLFGDIHQRANEAEFAVA